MLYLYAKLKTLKIMKTIKLLSLFALSGLLFVSCDEKQKEIKEEPTAEVEQVEVKEVTIPNIVEVAAGNENFSTLVAAVKAAGLAETLMGDGPFTVFAPTNAAFEKLPAGTVDGLLQPEKKADLSKILTYHVVSGKFDAAAVIKAINENNGKFTVTTVQGDNIDLSLKDGNVVLTDAKGGTATVVMADVPASNGIIHALDAVIMPK